MMGMTDRGWIAGCIVFCTYSVTWRSSFLQVQYISDMGPIREGRWVEPMWGGGGLDCVGDAELQSDGLRLTYPCLAGQ
jgi:hypothetical protein